jgi:hypothetical protein
MFRYLVLATILVLGTVAVVAGLQRAHPPLRVASVQSTGSPSPPRRQAGSDYRAGEATGVAPWALDTLLDCFHHVRTYEGPWAEAQARLPRDARPIPQNDKLLSGPCTLMAYAGEARVIRGAPPDASVDYTIPGYVAIFVRELPGSGGFGPWDMFVLRRVPGGLGRLEHLRTAQTTRLITCCRI